jgi:hypothetical protein
MKLPHPNLLLILNVNVLCMTILLIMSAHAMIGRTGYSYGRITESLL